MLFGGKARILFLKSSVLSASATVRRASAFCDTAHESSRSRITSSASDCAALVIILSECPGQVSSVRRIEKSRLMTIWSMCLSPPALARVPGNEQRPFDLEYLVGDLVVLLG